MNAGRVLKTAVGRMRVVTADLLNPILQLLEKFGDILGFLHKQAQRLMDFMGQSLSAREERC